MNSEQTNKKHIIKSILMISIPIIFTNILQVLYTLTDTFWVGKLGGNAIASVSIGFPIIFLMMAIANGLTVAGTVFVSQYKGKNDNENIVNFSNQTLIIVSILSIILSIIGFFSSEILLKLIGASNEILKDATDYLKISFVSLLPTFIFFVFQSLMRGFGEVKKATIIVSITVLINFFIDPLFIFGGFGVPAMGVAGSAIATAIAQIISATIALYFLFINKNNEIKLSLKNIKLDFGYIKQIFKVGLPSSFEQIVRSSGMIITTFIVSSFGTLIMASFGLGIRILSFVIIPAIGFMIAVSALVGQSIGRKDVKEAEEIAKQGSILAFISLNVVAVIFFIFAKQISSIFINNDPLVIEKSAEFIRYLSLCFGFLGVSMTLTGVLIGSGNTKTSMNLTILGTITGFIIAWVLAKLTPLSYTGLWLSYLINGLLILIITFVIIKKGKWKETKITDDVKFKEKVEIETAMQESIEE